MSGSSGDEYEASLLALAARGNVDALVDLVRWCFAQKYTGVHLSECAAMAEPFARLAAESGRHQEQIVLGEVLLNRAADLAERGFPGRATVANESALALFDMVADNGDKPALIRLASVLSSAADRGMEEAAERLNRLMEGLTPAEAAEISAGSKADSIKSDNFWREIAEIAAK